MNRRQSGRRRFLKDGAALAGLALGAAPSVAGQTLTSEMHEASPEDLHAYGERSHFETTIRKGKQGLWPAGGTRDYGFRTPLQNQRGIITPASLHFIISHGYEPPDLDPRQHRLLIHGMVDRPLTI
jgi:sulfane dehydrogenase subunit SoxC